MTLWIRDPFDKYASIDDMIKSAGGPTYNVWDSFDDRANTTFAIRKQTPFAVGQSLGAIGPGNTVYIRKAAPAPVSTIFCSMWSQVSKPGGDTSAFPGGMIEYTDSGTPQFTICMNYDFSITLRRGSNTGTVVATYSSAFSSTECAHFQFEVIVSGTVGEFHVRKNGATTDSFSATGLNTQATANSTVNGVGLTFVGTSSNGSANGDDFAAWDTTGSGAWTTWTGLTRCIRTLPNANSSVQMLQSNSGSTTLGSTTATHSNSRAANNILLFPFTAASGGTISSITVNLASGFTGHMKCAIYDGNGDYYAGNNIRVTGHSPGDLLGSTSQATNPVSGNNTFALTGAVPINPGHIYFLGLWNDAAATVSDNLFIATNPWAYALSYGSFPASLAGLGGGVSTPTCAISATITTANFGLAGDDVEDGGTTYVYSGSLNKKDLYGVQPSVFANTIIGVDVAGMVMKEASGPRTISMVLKSGATEVDYAAFAPNLTLGFVNYQQDTDPNTGAAWTGAAIQAALPGQKIVT